VELQEGLGLGLVSDQKPNVSVSSRSRKLRSRLHPWRTVLKLRKSILPYVENKLSTGILLNHITFNQCNE